MKNELTIRILIFYTVAFSLAALGGPLSSHYTLPTIPIANANSQYCGTKGSTGICSEFWYPAGPAMRTELATTYTSGPSEYTDLLSGSLDFTDWPCTPTTTCQSVSSSSTTVETYPNPVAGYVEIQFNLANSFWGVNMNFGNSAAGQQLRQGIAHMIDKENFTTHEPSLVVAIPIDNPVPLNNGGLPSANPCAWDTAFPEQNGAADVLPPPAPLTSDCQVGSPGGTAYHLADSRGANGYPWLQAPGSPDLNAAAGHFVNALSTVSGCNSISFNTTTSILNISSACQSALTATGQVPVLASYVSSSSDPARNDLQNSLMAQICYLFTGIYSAPCAYLNFGSGPIEQFPGFATNPTGVTRNWWLYIASYIGGTFFDDSLYFTYNSAFVDSYNCTGQVACLSCCPFPLAQANGGPCSNSAVATASAADYMYLCNSSYDSISSQIEFAPCLSSTGDPAPTQTNNRPGADCQGTTQLSAISAGVQAEDVFGQGAFTIPIYTEKQQDGYLNGWTRAINSVSSGLPNFFTWLNAYNPTPAQANTIRQGFAVPTRSLSPYIASTEWDYYILSNIYDSLDASNPLSPTELMNWMTIDTSQRTNSQLPYSPPSRTVTTYRFTLIPGLTFQDGTPVTSFDVAFSYLSLLGTGAFQSGTASSVIGITILNKQQFDMNLDSVGPFTLARITGLTIMPAKYWVASQSNWNAGIAACTQAMSANCYPVQYSLTGLPPILSCTLRGCSSFPVNYMQWDTTRIGASYDPLKNGILIGSSAWQCSSGSGLGGPGCSSTGAQNPGPGQSYTLTAHPNYVKSASALALWVWAADGSSTGPTILTYSVAALCYNSISAPVGTANSCGHFQTGIGGPAGTIASGTRGTALTSDPKLEFTGSTPFGAGDTIVYNVNGGTTFTPGDIVVGCVSTTTCTPPTAASLVGAPLNSDPLLEFRCVTAATFWSNGCSVTYDNDNSGGYDWGDVSSSPNSNSPGLFISAASGINIPPPPPGGCPAVGVAGTTTNGCWNSEGSTQVGIVALRVGLNWIAPYNWAVAPPLGIGAFPPVLYLPNVSQTSYASNYPVLNPSTVTGCTSPFNATSTNSGTTVGGYDC